MDPSQCIAKRCKEQTVMLCNLMQKADEMRCKMVQDGARWNPIELDGTSLKHSPALSLSDSWHSCAGQGTGELGPWVHNLWKKHGARPGQWNRDGSWLSFNVFQCLKMLSKCLTLSMLTFNADHCKRLPHCSFGFFWLQQLCCALKDSLRFQHWLLKARLAALMLGRTSTIIQFDDGIIEPYWTIENIWKLSSSAPLIPLSGDKAVPCVEQPVHSGPNCGPQFASVW